MVDTLRLERSASEAWEFDSPQVYGPTGAVGVG